MSEQAPLNLVRELEMLWDMVKTYALPNDENLAAYKALRTALAGSETTTLERAVVEAAIVWREENHAEHVSGEKAHASYVGLLEAIESLLKARKKVENG